MFLFKIINTDFKLFRYTFEIKFSRRYYYAKRHTFVNSMETSVVYIHHIEVISYNMLTRKR